MDENKELLEFIYEASDMGKHTVTSTLSLIKDKDNKIKKCTEDILKGYEEFYKKSSDKEADLFLCLENGLIYIPGENELFLYIG